MLNYIRAEVYKLARRKYTWIFLGVMLLLESLLVAAWTYTNFMGNHVDFYTGAIIVLSLLPMGFYAALLTSDIVFSEQYKHNTLKNEVSFGVPRGRIYLGKLLVQLGLSVVMCAVMIGYYLLLCALFLYPSAPESLEVLPQILGYCLLTALPLWVGVQGLFCAAYFLVRSSLMAAVVSLGLAGLVPAGLDLMGILFGDTALGQMARTLNALMPSTMLSTAVGVVGDWSFCLTAWGVGLVFLVVTTAFGLWRFHSREIN